MFFFVADIFEDIYGKVTKLGLTVKCFGGGKIEHKPKRKEIKVFGFSSVSLSFVFYNKRQIVNGFLF